MNKKKFHIILKRYLNGTATPAESELVEQWYNLLEDNSKLTDYQGNMDDIESRLWERIYADLHPEANHNDSLKDSKSVYYIWAKRSIVAASIVAIFLLAYFQFSISGNEKVNQLKSSAQGLHILQNSEEKPLEVVLEDGSKVVLQKNARISYPVHFEADKRSVYLEGEAFFEVAKNPARPFYVYCNNLITHVLGTSFTITPTAGKNEIEVAVKTGRVEVYENEKIVQNIDSKKSKGVVLLPNQKVIYNSGSRRFETSIVDIPLPLTSVYKADDNISPFIYNETPLHVVLSAIENTYGIQVIVENEGLNQCPITGDITEQGLFKKLDIINKILNTTYEVKGTIILLKGKGCN